MIGFCYKSLIKSTYDKHLESDEIEGVYKMTGNWEEDKDRFSHLWIETFFSRGNNLLDEPLTFVCPYEEDKDRNFMSNGDRFLELNKRLFPSMPFISQKYPPNETSSEEAIDWESNDNPYKDLVESTTSLYLNANDLFFEASCCVVGFDVLDCEWAVPVLVEFNKGGGYNAVLSYIQKIMPMDKYQTEEFLAAYKKIKELCPKVYSWDV